MCKFVPDAGVCQWIASLGHPAGDYLFYGSCAYVIAMCGLICWWVITRADQVDE